MSRPLALVSLFLPLAVAALPAAEPDLPKETTAKVLDADAAYLKAALDKPVTAKKLPYLRVATAMVALYGTDEARAQAAKLSAALSTNKAKEAFEQLKPAAGPKGNAARLIVTHKLTGESVMNHYGPAVGGGLNLFADLKALGSADPKAVDPGAVELMAARIAVLGEFNRLLPSSKADANEDKKKDWQKLNDDMTTQARGLAAEAAKGPKADKASLKKQALALEGVCVECHNRLK